MVVGFTAWSISTAPHDAPPDVFTARQQGTVRLVFEFPAKEESRISWNRSGRRSSAS
jgi:hypothetical protein